MSIKLLKKGRRHWRRFDFFIVNFEHISHLFLMFLLLTLNWLIFAGMTSSENLMTGLFKEEKMVIKLFL